MQHERHCLAWQPLGHKGEQEGSPAPLSATSTPYLASRLPVAGPARGSQSTYDRALRCLFGADDSQLAGKRGAA